MAETRADELLLEHVIVMSNQPQHHDTSRQHHQPHHSSGVSLDSRTYNQPRHSSQHKSADEHEQDKKSNGGQHESSGEGQPWYLLGLFQPPRVLRDWHNINHHDNRKISWSELFFDLVFVTIIAKMGEAIRGAEMTSTHYAVTFILVWCIWNASVVFATRFFVDDIPSKLYLALFMLGSFGIGMHVLGGIDGENTLGFHLACIYVRTLVLLMYARVYYYLPRARVLCHTQFIIQGVSTLILIISVSFVPIHYRIYMLLLIIIWDLISPYLSIFMIDSKSVLPIHIHHYIERIGLFVIIVLGESINGLCISPTLLGKDGDAMTMYITAFFGFWLVFCLKLLYFDIDTQDLEHHAIRRSKYTSMIWTQLHIPLVASLAIIGSALMMICLETLNGVDETNDKQNSIERQSVNVLSTIVLQDKQEAELAGAERLSRYEPRLLVCLGVFVYYSTLALLRLTHKQGTKLINCPLCCSTNICDAFDSSSSSSSTTTSSSSSSSIFSSIFSSISSVFWFLLRPFLSMTFPTQLTLLFYIQITLQFFFAIISLLLAQYLFITLSNKILLCLLSIISIILVLINLIDKALISSAYRIHESHRSQVDNKDMEDDTTQNSQSINVSRDEDMESQAPSRDETPANENDMSEREAERVPLKSPMREYGTIQK